MTNKGIKRVYSKKIRKLEEQFDEAENKQAKKTRKLEKKLKKEIMRVAVPKSYIQKGIDYRYRLDDVQPETPRILKMLSGEEVKGRLERRSYIFNESYTQSQTNYTFNTYVTY